MDPPNKYNGKGLRYKLYDSIKYLKSRFELAYLQQLLDTPSISQIQYESERIIYFIDEEQKIYIPDFKFIDSGKIVIAEVKPCCFQEDELVILKTEAAIKYCNKQNWEFRLVGEQDIDFDNYPNYDDQNIVPSEPTLTHEEVVELRRRSGVANPEYADHFMTKIWEGNYNYLDHPRTNPEITYNSIMDYVNSFPPYECTKDDVYNFCTRNQLIRRLRDEAEGKDKDIQYWQSHYLAIPERTSTSQKRAMLEVQLDGLREFGLLTLNEIENYLISLNRKVWTGDVYNLLGWGQNKTRLYFWGVLNSDIYEVIEEINSKVEGKNACI